MHFKEIKIKGWQQFSNVFIEFDQNLTVITGANGSGKTTILNILAMHHNWPFQSLATPQKDKKGVWKYLASLFGKSDESDSRVIGSISYSDNTQTHLSVPADSGPQYQIQIPQKKDISCFFIPSHRSLFRYQQLTNIPTQKKNKKQAFDEVSNITRQRYQSGREQPSSFIMKNALIGWAIKGYGVQNNDKYIMPKDNEQIEFYEGFQDVLKDILPKTLGFKELEIRNMEIVFICNDGRDEFILETASGGISSLIDLAWQIYMYSPDRKTPFTVLIDEVENHLHPTMQRRVLPDLIKAFPNVKFIVATHSPLIVNSYKYSKVDVLQYTEDNKIESNPLDYKNLPSTANDILNDVLGVSTSLPIWVEEKLNEIIKNNQYNLVNKEGFRKLRSDLKELGFDKLLPEAIDNILGDSID